MGSNHPKHKLIQTHSNHGFRSESPDLLADTMIFSITSRGYHDNYLKIERISTQAAASWR